MGVAYLWDTNTVIYYLQKQFPATAELFMDKLLITNNPPAIAAITEIELCWKTATHSDMLILNSFINDAQVVEIEKNIRLKTVEIRRANRIKLPDAIIAATALVNDYTLLTRNVQDFNTIPTLKTINPWNA